MPYLNRSPKISVICRVQTSYILKLAFWNFIEGWHDYGSYPRYERSVVSTLNIKDVLILESTVKINSLLIIGLFSIYTLCNIGHKIWIRSLGHIIWVIYYDYMIPMRIAMQLLRDINHNSFSFFSNLIQNIVKSSQTETSGRYQRMIPRWSDQIKRIKKKNKN